MDLYNMQNNSIHAEPNLTYQTLGILRYLLSALYTVGSHHPSLAFIAALANCVQPNL
jgi:hypothetical protein